MTDGELLRSEADRCFRLALRIAAPKLSADLVARGRALERQAVELETVFGRSAATLSRAGGFVLAGRGAAPMAERRVAV